MDFPHIFAAADSVRFVLLHCLGPVAFAQVVLTLMRWLTQSGVTFGSAKVNSLHACLSPAGTRPRVRTIDPSQTTHSRKVACLCPQSCRTEVRPTRITPPRQGGGGSPGLPLVCVNIIEHNADANPQFRRGYMEDSPRASRLS